LPSGHRFLPAAGCGAAAKAVLATYVQTPDKKYKVTLTAQAKKLKSDGSGNEIPDDNTIDVTKP
jgi:hypothetical protein